MLVLQNHWPLETTQLPLCKRGSWKFPRLSVLHTQPDRLEHWGAQPAGIPRETPRTEEHMAKGGGNKIMILGKLLLYICLVQDNN